MKAHKCTALARDQARARPPRLHVRDAPRDRGPGRRRPRRRPAARERGRSTRSACGDARRGSTRASRSPSTRPTTIEAAAARRRSARCLVDVNVGLPRCGCAPTTRARSPTPRGARASRCAASWATRATSSGSPTAPSASRQTPRRWRCSRRRTTPSAATSSRPAAPAPTTSTSVATEIQAGSYALMDTAYGELGAAVPTSRCASPRDRRARSAGYAVADCGLKALGMDHGNPTVEGGDVWFCSDEHVTFSPGRCGAADGRRPRPRLPRARRPDRRVPRALPPRRRLDADAEIIDTWPIDLRGW